MSEVAHVTLGDDYYEHEWFRDTSHSYLSDYDKDRIFEIPVETLVRWEAAEAAWRNVQGEIQTLMHKRRQDPGFARPAVPVKCYKGTWTPPPFPSPGLPF